LVRDRRLALKHPEPSMTLLIIFSAWILVLSFVVALCLAARRGDLEPEPASAAGRCVETPESRVIAAHASPRRGRSPEPRRSLDGAGARTS
jgi:hypothetical protein